ncbi:fructosamine kinase family protein [Saliterribacillus persicus]|uniref:Fructosamine-3-kinase n=1 Tax=Saliterribacillus persicus TaxID=930114 RepID=A0A368YDI0_9BACI|nr:fructosamine kinase family protein [Saliterribacillus persicus]RCW77488.1 fructosamine-3-kinase [Saliterribacillus persicus]
MQDFFQQALANIEDHSEIKKMERVSGGDINDAYFVQTNEQAYFIKVNQDVPRDFFEIEANGLQAIKDTKTIKVPEVYFYNQPEQDEKALLILEWIEKGSPNASSSKLLGEQLAKMHHPQKDKKFGAPHDTFVGEITQENGWYEDWLGYYKEKRLTPQLNLGIENGRIQAGRRKKLEKLINQLDKYIEAHPPVSLLHGDLWGGNWMADKNGTPYLIDPSLLYGDHAFELAFTELFGGFGNDFYTRYQDIFPLPPHYEEVKEIYQLFYLLVHLNIFGEGYGASVDRILDYYV